MITINPKETEITVLHQYLLGAVGPRPICFVSTIDKNGNHNLAPFSFFNVFSVNPPLAIFSPNLNGRTGAKKDTLLNILEVPECVINLVTYNMVEQMSLTSSPFPREVDEFTKSGFTSLKSELVSPLRVAESPVQLECKVMEVKTIGACNLVFCEILKMHVSESVLNKDNKIDQTKIDLVARMGGNFYARAHGDALFEIEKPISSIGIGVDMIPADIKNNAAFTGNDLGKLGGIEKLPTLEDCKTYYQQNALKLNTLSEKCLYAKKLLNQNLTAEAWNVLMG